MNRLQRLHADFGQSPWLDNLKRGYITSGQLTKLVGDGVRGLTSNPTIFQKAITGSPDYDEQFASLIQGHTSVEDAYWAMVIDDINGALDAFADVYKNSNGVDGFVSLEVSPTLAHDTAGTIAAARHLHTKIDRPNLMVKIPGTSEGVPAIQQMFTDGRSINITLIFSLDRYADVMEAYVAGLEANPSHDLSNIQSVASFFISRVDSEIDRRLDHIGSDGALALRGKAAVAQAQVAYQLFLAKFSGPRWEALAARGAAVQRPLWASTSTKNPTYPDLLYVDTLIGPHTVNTLPDATLAAVADHGVLARTIDAHPAVAQKVLDDVTEAGVDLDDVAHVLETEGVASFGKSFAELIGALEAKAAELTA